MIEMRDDPMACIAAWLAGIFIAPLGREAIVEQSSAACEPVFDAIGDALHCRRGTVLMRLALLASDSSHASERRLGNTYTRLFEGVGGPGTVPLYESAYGDSGRRLFQGATVEMESLLQRTRLAITGSCHEPSDHLSIELSLLSTLLRADDGHTVQLLVDRLRSWVPQFCTQCKLGDATGYYSGAAMLLNRLVTLPAPHGLQRAA